MLSAEVHALGEGQAASLPFLKGDQAPARWITVAPNAETLQAAVDGVRAWVIPSFAWEDQHSPFRAPKDASEGTAADLEILSPAGYYRWECDRRALETVVGKLRGMRRLDTARPDNIAGNALSLFELRQQFETALLTGDRGLAVEAITKIDREGLDSALNTRLMWVALRDQFREFADTVADPTLALLLRSRIPSKARLALIRAFYSVYLAPAEARDDFGRAVEEYALHVHPAVGGAISLSEPADGRDVARCIAYRAGFLGEVEVLERTAASSESTADVVALAAALLAGVASISFEGQRTANRPSAPSLPERLEAAAQAGDALAIQEIGLEWLSENRNGSASSLSAEVCGRLWRSLDVLPNPRLREALELVAGRVPWTESHAGIVESTSTPQTWVELQQCLARAEWDDASTFLSSEQRPDASDLSAGEIASLSDLLDDLYTVTPTAEHVHTYRRVMEECTRILVDDLVREPEFPRPGRTDLYTQLARLWHTVRAGSANVADSSVLLTLTGAVLERSVELEHEVADLLSSWWSARPRRAALPFALEAIDLLVQCSDATGATQTLLLGALEVAGQDASALTIGEIRQWRRLARAVLSDEDVVESYFGKSAIAEAESRPDPLSVISGPVAIISLREEPARVAAVEIAERTGSEVDVVVELVPGPGTARAQQAEVVLFVWSASKHAVFRAFDDIRDRLVYVPGTGAASIVLALERWANSRTYAV